MSRKSQLATRKTRAKTDLSEMIQGLIDEAVDTNAEMIGCVEEDGLLSSSPNFVVVLARGAPAGRLKAWLQAEEARAGGACEVTQEAMYDPGERIH